METIALSVMSYDTGLDDLRAVLAEFEARQHVQVQIVPLSWDSAWTQIVKYALYGDAPAVSEIGSTWVASLATMNALRPFTAQEILSFGGQAAFLPAAWQSGQILNDPTLWAMPWLAETRVIFYWRDMLEAASLDAQTAFQTPDQLAHTLAHLKSRGIAAPWCVPTQPTLTTFHDVASWIWGAGGDFLAADQRRVLFNQAEARAGLRSYYDLQRFLPPADRSIAAGASDALFLSGQAAATLSGPWLWPMAEAQLAANQAARLGAALPPGVPLVSESHLAIWRTLSPHHEHQAVELVRFLTTKQAQLKCSQQTGLLPVHTEALAVPHYADHPIYRVMRQGVQSGRSFPAMRLWGLLEERLTSALGNIWQKILAAEQPDLDVIIQAELDPLAQRLNHTLEMS